MALPASRLTLALPSLPPFLGGTLGSCTLQAQEGHGQWSWTDNTVGLPPPKDHPHGQEIVCMQRNQTSTNYFMNKNRYCGSQSRGLIAGEEEKRTTTLAGYQTAKENTHINSTS